MPDDRVSRYRLAQLTLYIPPRPGLNSPWALRSVTVKRGVPHAAVLLDGYLRVDTSWPSTEQILEYMDAAVRQSMLL